jgi:hypothetical protein
MNIRNGILFIMLSSAVIFSASCSKDNDKPKPDTDSKPVSVVMVKDLPADPTSRDPNTGETIGGTNQYTFFRFSDSAVVSHTDSASTKWDIGFRGTDIIINGGTSGPGSTAGQVVNNTFEDITQAPEANYIADNTSGHVFADWYVYNMQTHIVTSKPGYIFIIRTNDGKFVKMEIISYYKGAPAQPDLTDASRYYTFRYVYQPDGSTNLNEQEK